MSFQNKSMSIKSFVQNTLGCTCPDTIFDRQEIENGITISGVENCVKLCIGEKLLIYLVSIETINNLSTSITSILSEGRKERDSRHLNRFRLVLVANDVEAISGDAHMVFDSIDDLDDKVHLHVLSNQECAMHI